MDVWVSGKSFCGPFNNSAGIFNWVNENLSCFVCKEPTNWNADVILQQVSSEGELCPADTLGSAGSSSTLASSVIEVEVQKEELVVTANQEEKVLRTNQQVFWDPAY